MAVTQSTETASIMLNDLQLGVMTTYGLVTLILITRGKFLFLGSAACLVYYLGYYKCSSKYI
jgi:hypothetical protein